MILKRKSRYLLVESSVPIDFAVRERAQALERELLRFLGEREFSDAHPQVIERFGNNAFAMRVNRGSEKRVVLALAFAKRLDDTECGFYSISTSGTMRSLKATYSKLYGAGK